MLIGMVLCSTAIYFIEKDVINPQTDKYPFESIPAAFWWSIVTMTTVGYGDAVPQTAPGKLIGGITSLCGILVLALPITVISNNFNQEMEKMQRSQENSVKSIQTLRKLLTERYQNMVEHKREQHSDDVDVSKALIEERNRQRNEIEKPAVVQKKEDLTKSSARISMVDIEDLLRRDDDNEENGNNAEVCQLTQNAMYLQQKTFNVSPYLSNEDI